MKNPINGMTPTLKTIAVLVILVSSIGGSAWRMDTRYAKASDVEQQMSGLTVLYLESELRALRRQLFELQVASQNRRLTTLEVQRLEEIKREVMSLEVKISRVRDGRKF